MKKKVTMKDIAAETGYSVMTVSNVINGNTQRTSTETINRVNKAIEALNYIPNFSARSLVKKQSKLIGVIIPQTEEENQVILENPFYSELVSGIEAKLREKDYYMILTGVDADKSYMDVFVKWNLDGAILLGIYKEGLYEELKKSNVPIVLLDSYIDDDFYYKVGIDDEHGGYLATKYLIEAGHRHIALVTGKIRREGVEEKRYLGYCRALKEFDIPLNEAIVYQGHVDYEYGIEVGKKVAKAPHGITAIFAVADVLAAGVITGLHEMSINVPNQISVMGFDNIPMSRMMVPSLTTVDQNIYQKGIQSINLLIDVIEKKNEVKDKRITMPVSILERKSVKPLK